MSLRSKDKIVRERVAEFRLALERHPEFKYNV